MMPSPWATKLYRESHPEEAVLAHAIPTVAMVREVAIGSERAIALGDGRVLVASASDPGRWHIVSALGGSCDCMGFLTRGRCRHGAIATAANEADISFQGPRGETLSLAELLEESAGYERAKSAQADAVFAKLAQNASPDTFASTVSEQQLTQAIGARVRNAGQSRMHPARYEELREDCRREEM